MAWCEANDVDYVFGLPGNGVRRAVWSRSLPTMSGCVAPKPRRRCYAAIPRPAMVPNPGAASGAWWTIEASTQGLDIRYVVPTWTAAARSGSTTRSTARAGQAENLIKLHKSQLASDRTSRRSALANQVRLVLHTAAYWLMLTVRDAIDKPHPLANAEFTTLRDAPPQNRRTHHRDRHTRPRRLCCSMPGPRIVSPHRHQPPARRRATRRVLRPRTHPVPPTSNAVMNLTDFAMRQVTCSNAPAPQTAPSTSMR